ncbi:YciI family protein (plasmid) [Coraliomargarita sp. W4R53]
MEYMLIIGADESQPKPGPGEAGFEEMMGAWADYTRRLLESGAFVSGGSLQPSSTATTVRKSWGVAPMIVDGPFAETKEQLAGFYVVRAADLDEALALAAELPIPVGSVEVRPLMMRPDETGAPRPVS